MQPIMQPNVEPAAPPLKSTSTCSRLSSNSKCNWRPDVSLHGLRHRPGVLRASATPFPFSYCRPLVYTDVRTQAVSLAQAPCFPCWHAEKCLIQTGRRGNLHQVRICTSREGAQWLRPTTSVGIRQARSRSWKWQHHRSKGPSFGALTDPLLAFPLETPFFWTFLILFRCPKPFFQIITVQAEQTCISKTRSRKFII